MHDLKSKMLALGLVTQEQAKRVSTGPKRSKAKKTEHKHVDRYEEKQRQKQLHMLQTAPNKNEQYGMIRRWVERHRLDLETLPTDVEAERFFFEKEDGNVAWLTIQKPVHQQIQEGNAAIMAYMSNHGLSYCVVPKDIAEDVAHVFPSWIRVFKEKESA